MLQNRGKRLPPWGIRNSVFQPLRNQKLCFQMTMGGGFTKVAKQNKTKNKKQTNGNKQTNRQNTWRFAKHCQTFLDTWLVLATFVEIMSKASNFWKALRSAEVWLWVIQGSTKEVPSRKNLKVLYPSSAFLVFQDRGIQLFKVDDTNNKALFPQRLTLSPGNSIKRQILILWIWGGIRESTFPTSFLGDDNDAAGLETTLWVAVFTTHKHSTGLCIMQEVRVSSFYTSSPQTTLLVGDCSHEQEFSNLWNRPIYRAKARLFILVGITWQFHVDKVFIFLDSQGRIGGCDKSV